MPTIALLLALSACLTGCATSRWSAKLPPTSSLEAVDNATVFGPDQLADIPTRRFCRVHSTNPDTLHEGTVVCTTADEVVLSNAAVLGPRTMGLFGNLSFDWSHRTSRGVDVTFPDRVTIPRAEIASVDVFDAEDGEPARTAFAQWRAKQKRIHRELLTEQEFPSSG